MITTIFLRTLLGVVALTGLLAFSAGGHARDYLKGERPQQRGYSEAVITEGGKMVWLAGQIATVDDAGKSLASDFDGQVRQLFKNLDRTLQKAGGKLSDMVQMTVFITDVRYGDRLNANSTRGIRRQFPGQRTHHNHRTGRARGQDRDTRLRRNRRQIGIKRFEVLRS